MRLIVHVAHVLWAALRFGRSTGRLSVLLIVIIGLILIALTVSAQAIVPLATYPFA